MIGPAQTLPWHQTLPNWVPDEAVSECYSCSRSFTLVTRRHHCRQCGEIFCGACSSKTVRLKQMPGDNHRVCNECYQFTTLVTQFERMYLQLLTTPTTFLKYTDSKLGVKSHERIFEVDKEFKNLKWYAEEDYKGLVPPKEISIKSINAVKKGQDSAVFKKSLSSDKMINDSGMDKCFSIVTWDRTIDVQAATPEICRKWMEGIDTLRKIVNMPLCTHPISTESVGNGRTQLTPQRQKELERKQKEKEIREKNYQAKRDVHKATVSNIRERYNIPEKN